MRRVSSRFVSPRPILNFTNYDHKFKREHAQASVVLKQDEKYNELTMKIRLLLGQMQKVDPTVVIEPATARWEKSPKIPFDLTNLGVAIKVADNARFEKVKPWGNMALNADGTEAEMMDPEVYFSFCFSSDEDPEVLLKAIRIEWKRQGAITTP